MIEPLTFLGLGLWVAVGWLATRPIKSFWYRRFGPKYWGVSDEAMQLVKGAMLGPVTWGLTCLELYTWDMVALPDYKPIRRWGWKW